MTTGMDLKVERIREKVTARSVARAMGVSSQRVAQIEATQFISDTLAGRYRDALRQVAVPMEIPAADSAAAQ